MKIKEWEVDEGNDSHGNRGMMVLVTKSEALSVIQSLANQVQTGDCNCGRVEFIAEDGEEFSIGVLEEEVSCDCNYDDDNDVCAGCYNSHDYCTCGYDQKNVIDTCKPMNAFARARYNKTQE